MSDAPFPAAVEVGHKLKPRRFERHRAAAEAVLVEGEHVCGVYWASKAFPLIDGVVVTNARILGVSLGEVTKQVAAPNLRAMVIEPGHLGTPKLRLRLDDGVIEDFGDVRLQDWRALDRQIGRLIGAAGPAVQALSERGGVDETERPVPVAPRAERRVVSPTEAMAAAYDDVTHVQFRWKPWLIIASALGAAVAGAAVWALASSGGSLLWRLPIGLLLGHLAVDSARFVLQAVLRPALRIDADGFHLVGDGAAVPWSSVRSASVVETGADVEMVVVLRSDDAGANSSRWRWSRRRRPRQSEGQITRSTRHLDAAPEQIAASLERFAP